MAGRQTRASADGSQQPLYDNTDRHTPRQAQQQGLSPPYTTRNSTQGQTAQQGSQDELMPDGFGGMDNMFPQGPTYSTSGFSARPMFDQGHYPISSALIDEVLSEFIMNCARDLYPRMRSSLEDPSAKATLVGLMSTMFQAEISNGERGGTSESNNSVGNENSTFCT
ncbi:uncharacterized protein N7511_008493 [Penicillium nucicola]|uniref:uncharacterized protein n=1 Tax=Penicillium nucicola TaxID=1850975 RepID=UPI00254571FC|nr:uncharacterized protein N7511_008493 [Penicillium nucicola]KAJ5751528.1 hypothetical protein N7511_008493 [Penicillium nucicola]